MADAARISDPVQSPCIGVCTLGPNDLCIGCMRTSREIGDWLGYSEAERKRITAELPGRLEALFSM
ncbi:DUF1289 domain-containing protein [Elongatibacter sediminis]|uniref:DUF1289 domain-containing protein n=1 Tax=Elongatibacter sediminis TaxID=3119006 RepID=A0AAW9RF81_9GAMM